MPKLALAMIVKNEADCLAECLSSAAGIVDEIVIGDTGSTDGTRDIARRFGARIIEAPWTGDFAAARNAVLDEVRSDWVLHLDADEALDPCGARRVREIVDADADVADAIEVTLANYCDDIQAWRWKAVEPGDPFARGFSGYIEVGLLRLFRRDSRIRYREPVHENVTESVADSGCVVRSEPIVIHHYGYACSDDKRRQKAAAYLEIARNKTKQRPDSPKSWHDFAELALSLGMLEEAEAALRHALRLSPEHIGAAMTLATILLNRGDLDEAERLLMGLGERNVLPTHGLVALGGMALRRGCLERAASLVGRAMQLEPRSIIAQLFMARVLDCEGNAAEAARILEGCARTSPSAKEVVNRRTAHELRQKAEFLHEAGRVSEALAALTESLRADPDDPVTYNDLGVVLASVGVREKARAMFQNALRLMPTLSQARDNLEKVQ